MHGKWLINTLNSLFNALKCVSSFTVATTSKTGLAGNGEGFLSPVFHGCALEINLAGKLTTNTTIEIKSKYTWKLNQNKLVLSHERHGDMFDIVHANNNIYQNNKPFNCPPDTYNLKIILERTQVILHWIIAGTLKDETAIYTYKTTPTL